MDAFKAYLLYHNAFLFAIPSPLQVRYIFLITIGTAVSLTHSSPYFISLFYYDDLVVVDLVEIKGDLVAVLKHVLYLCASY